MGMGERLQSVGVDHELAGEFDVRFAERSLETEGWNDWVEAVDESDYGWPEWVRAILDLDQKVAGKSPRELPSLSRLIGYVGCVAEVAGKSPIPAPLDEEVGTAFEDYGFAEED